jgi:hypothetical protein
MRGVVIVILILLIAAFSADAQRAIKLKMLAAKEPGDSSFVVFVNGERKGLKSLKDDRVTLKIKFSDGTEERYNYAQRKQIRGYQDDKGYYALLDCNGTSANINNALYKFGSRVEKGPIELYHVDMESWAGGQTVRGVAYLMVPAPGRVIELNHLKERTDSLEKYVKKSPAAMSKIQEVRRKYMEKSVTRDKLVEVVVLYNKDAAEGKLE